MAINREGLTEVLSSYMAALDQNDPSALPLSPNVRFTENGQVLALGKGLWATATPAPDLPRYFETSDPEIGQAVYWGTGAEAQNAVILAVRLKVVDSRITEIETMVIRRPPPEGHPRVFAPEALLERREAYFEVVPVEERSSRTRLIECGNLYLDGILQSRGDLIPVSDDAVRIENGVQTTLDASRDEDLGGLSVADQISSGIFRDIEAARDRRVIAVDEERGLLVMAFSFDHPGPVTRSSFVSRFDQPNTMAAFEVFKIRNGLIAQIESVINVVPYGMKSGWD